MASSNNSEQIRVILWAPPRSLSTVFEKCMSYVDDVQIINEPYNGALINNADAMQKTTDTFKDGIDKLIADAELVQDNANIAAAGWDQTTCTSAWVKGLLEGDFPGKKIIFVKDLHTGIKDQFHMIPLKDIGILSSSEIQPRYSYLNASWELKCFKYLNSA